MSESKVENTVSITFPVTRLNALSRLIQCSVLLEDWMEKHGDDLLPYDLAVRLYHLRTAYLGYKGMGGTDFSGSKEC